MPKKEKHRFSKSLLSLIGGPLLFNGRLMKDTAEADTGYNGRRAFNPEWPRSREVVWDAIALYACLCKDVLCIDEQSANEGRLLKAFKAIEGTDIFCILQCLDEKATLLLRSVTDPEITIRHIKAVNPSVARDGSEFLDTLDGLSSPLLRRWFFGNEEAAFASLRTLYEFLKRLNFRDVRLAAPTFTAWWLAEQIPDGEVPQGIIEIAQHWFPIEDTAIIAEYFVPHHSGGAVYEGSLPKLDKYMLNHVNDQARTTLTELGLGEFYLQNRDTMQNWRIFQYDETDDTHRVMGVPKSYKVYRTVSMEKAALQFFAEGAMSAIFSYLRDPSINCPLRHHYCVTTEDRNRELARIGSIDGTFCTIDLSSASDTVRNSLVELVLGQTCLYPLLHLRTQYAKWPSDPSEWETIYGGSTYQVKKFAPMGNAITFPIESIIFCLITEYCVRCTEHASHIYWVYGDDIVCDVKVAHLLMETLKKMGFLPNIGKSFFNATNSCRGFFRESCGAEYLNGIDVAPMRISRKFDGFRTGGRALAQNVMLANELYSRGYRHARAFVIERLQNFHDHLLFDYDGSRGIQSPNATNQHLKHRWNSNLQRDEVCATYVVSRDKIPGPSRDDVLEHLADFSVEWQKGARIPTIKDRWITGEVRLYEYLTQASRFSRQSLLYPEDRVDSQIEPFSFEMDTETKWTWCDHPLSSLVDDEESSKPVWPDNTGNTD